MKKREKILAGIVLGFIGLIIVGFLLRGFFLSPLKKIDQQTKLLRDKITKVNKERKEYFDAEDALKEITSRTFAIDINQASARLGETLTKQIAQAGLNEGDFTRLPVGPRKLRGASEIGWSIQGKGDLQKIVNLLFLLESAPHLHRLENLSLTAHEKPGELKVRFFYLTLVIEPAPDVQIAELKHKYTLESPERLVYNSILERDILRPYIKRPPPPPPPPAGKPGGPTTAPPAPPGPESFKVVSLSQWEGQSEVHVRDLTNNKTLAYKPGDKLDGGEIVAVDYRPMPLPRNPLLRSDSRLILKIGNDFWAVERGQTLAEKRKLAPEQWPMN